VANPDSRGDLFFLGAFGFWLLGFFLGLGGLDGFRRLLHICKLRLDFAYASADGGKTNSNSSSVLMDRVR